MGSPNCMDQQRLLLAKLPLLNRNASPEIVFSHCESIFETPCHPRRCQKCKLKSLQSRASLSLIMTFFSSNTITYDVYCPTPLLTKKKSRNLPNPVFQHSTNIRLGNKEIRICI